MTHLLKRPTIYIGLVSFLCFNSCDSGDGDDPGSVVDPMVFEVGFNPETLEVDSQVWFIGNANFNFVSSVISDTLINYDYTIFGQRVTSDNVVYNYSSLGTSATLSSNFNFTGNQSVYNTLTAELSDDASPLSVALGVYDANDESSAADVIVAANNAVPNLILFVENGILYTLDSLELSTNNDNQGTLTLLGTPIVFTNDVASQGDTGSIAQISTVEVSFRTPGN